MLAVDLGTEGRSSKRSMAAELTHDEVKKWAARVRREAQRNPRFDHKAPYTWAAVGELAHAIWKAGLPGTRP